MADYVLTGGVTAIDEWGQRDAFTFTGTWLPGEWWRVNFTSTIGNFTLGAGNLLDAGYNFLLTYGDRVFAANGDFWNFSSLNDPRLETDGPLGWEEQDIGAGRVNFRTAVSVTDSAVSLAITQGRLAVFGRYNVQIWNIDADPDQFARVQILQNIGTVAPQSVQSIGELDVLFLDDTGIRSLRTRETTLNAFVDDVGVPIDSVIQGVLNGLTDSQKATAISVVEPTSKRYWLHLNGVIYVLSNFPSSKIRAWTTYTPQFAEVVTPTGANYSIGGAGGYTGLTAGRKYSWIKGANDTSISDGTTTLTASGEFIPVGTTATLVGTPSAAVTSVLTQATSFTPASFSVFQGKVYVTDANGYYYILGGTNGTTYDLSIATADMPWLDISDPTMIKQGKGFDIAMKGPWQLYASMNPRADAPREVISKGSQTSPNVLQDSTFDTGHYPYSASGTHFKIKVVSKADPVAAKVGKISFLYDDANKK